MKTNRICCRWLLIQRNEKASAKQTNQTDWVFFSKTPNRHHRHSYCHQTKRPNFSILQFILFIVITERRKKSQCVLIDKLVQVRIQCLHRGYTASTIFQSRRLSQSIPNQTTTKSIRKKPGNSVLSIPAFVIQWAYSTPSLAMIENVLRSLILFSMIGCATYDHIHASHPSILFRTNSLGTRTSSRSHRIRSRTAAPWFRFPWNSSWSSPNLRDQSFAGCTAEPRPRWPPPSTLLRRSSPLPLRKSSHAHSHRSHGTSPMSHAAWAARTRREPSCWKTLPNGCCRPWPHTPSRTRGTRHSPSTSQYPFEHPNRLKEATNIGENGLIGSSTPEGELLCLNRVPNPYHPGLIEIL